MRELKFRAWDTERKTYDHEELLLAPNGDILASRWQELCEPESVYIVEQYTGLKDKTGKEIYEGDMVECSFGESGVVEFRHGAYCVVGDDINDMSNWKETAFEVIGNIHENPELLNRKEEE